MNRLELFHGTNLNKAKDILKQGFKSSLSSDYNPHWMGNGIYFYDDYELAKNWPKKLNNIADEEMCVLESTIEFDNKNFASLNNPKYKSDVILFFNRMSEEYGEDVGFSVKNKNLLYQVRCKLFNFISSLHLDIYLFKANFIVNLSDSNNISLISRAGIVEDYETQYCVKNPDIIKSVKLVGKVNYAEQIKK